ncbi:MAG TPA: hypothetical protein EYH44_01265 [Thermoprotei archaeon]|nr:hypothetical protein [Thermoprotei archaeon]
MVKIYSKKKIFFLVDPENTKPGDEFILVKNDVCEKCRYFRVCFGDKKIGFNYRITKILKTKGEVYCRLIEKNVMLAEVEEAPIKLSIPSINLVLNVPISYTPIKCAEKQCPYIKFCVYNGHKLKSNITINRVIDRLDCPIGLDLLLVEASPLS